MNNKITVCFMTIIFSLALSAVAYGGNINNKQTSKAISSFQSWVDNTGALKTHIVNRRFSHHQLWNDKSANERIVLEETFDLKDDSNREGAEGKVSVKIYELDKLKVNKYRTLFSGAGTTGEVFNDELYRITAIGCCDSSNIETFFSLRSGKNIFISTTNPLIISSGNSFKNRYISFNDSPKYASNKTDNNIIGEIYYSDGIKKRGVYYVYGPKNAYMHIKSIDFINNKQRMSGNRYDLPPELKIRDFKDMPEIGLQFEYSIEVETERAGVYGAFPGKIIARIKDDKIDLNNVHVEGKISIKIDIGGNLTKR